MESNHHSRGRNSLSCPLNDRPSCQASTGCGDALVRRITVRACRSIYASPPLLAQPRPDFVAVFSAAILRDLSCTPDPTLSPSGSANFWSVHGESNAGLKLGRLQH